MHFIDKKRNIFRETEAASTKKKTFDEKCGIKELAQTRLWFIEGDGCGQNINKSLQEIKNQVNVVRLQDILLQQSSSH